MLINSAKIGARGNNQGEESDASQQFADQQNDGQPCGDALPIADEEQSCQQGSEMQPVQR